MVNNKYIFTISTQMNTKIQGEQEVQGDTENTFMYNLMHNHEYNVDSIYTSDDYWENSQDIDKRINEISNEVTCNKITKLSQNILNPKLNPRQIMNMEEGETKTRFMESIRKELYSHIIEKQSLKLIKFSEMEAKAEIINSKMIVHNKLDTLGELIKAKARLVARGDEQKENEVTRLYKSAPTAGHTALMIFLSIIGSLGMIIEVMDVGTAYLNATYVENKDMYMRIDRILAQQIEEAIGVELNDYYDKKGRIYTKIEKAIYGTKEAAKLWYNELTKALQEFGFRRCEAEHCVWIKETNDNKMILLMYVDDILVASMIQSHIDELYDYLINKYKEVSRKKGDTQEFLSMNIEVMRQEKKVRITMPAMLEDIKTWSLYDETMKTSRPWLEDLFEEPEIHENEQNVDLDEAEAEEFRSIIAKLGYIYERVAVGGNVACAYLRTKASKPTKKNRKDLKVLTSYTYKNRENMEIFLSCNFDENDGINVTMFTDASHGITSNGRGMGGCVIMIGLGAIYHRSNILQYNTGSSSESETIQVSDKAKVLLWILSFIRTLGYECKGTIYVDNRAAKNFCERSGFGMSSNLKHMKLRYLWLQDYVANGEFVIKWCCSERMIADLYTKNLMPLSVIRYFKEQISGKRHVDYDLLTQKEWTSDEKAYLKKVKFDIEE